MILEVVVFRVPEYKRHTVYDMPKTLFFAREARSTEIRTIFEEKEIRSKLQRFVRSNFTRPVRGYNLKPDSEKDHD